MSRLPAYPGLIRHFRDLHCGCLPPEEETAELSPDRVQLGGCGFSSMSVCCEQGCDNALLFCPRCVRHSDTISMVLTHTPSAGFPVA